MTNSRNIQDQLSLISTHCYVVKLISEIKLYEKGVLSNYQSICGAPDMTNLS